MNNIYATATRAIAGAYRRWQQQQRFHEQFEGYQQRMRLSGVRYANRSRHQPRQGKQECVRRLRNWRRGLENAELRA